MTASSSPPRPPARFEIVVFTACLLAAPLFGTYAVYKTIRTLQGSPANPLFDLAVAGAAFLYLASFSWRYSSPQPAAKILAEAGLGLFLLSLAFGLFLAPFFAS
jgi:hypothetical protein